MKDSAQHLPSDFADVMMYANLKEVREHLKAGVSVDNTDDDGNTPLHLACKSVAWDGGILEFLISKKSKVNATNNKGQTPLHMAAEEAWGQAISLLLKAGADPNAIDQEGNTPAHYARDTEDLAVLVKAKADLSIKNKLGESFLHHYMREGMADPKSYRWILKQKIDLNDADVAGMTPLHCFMATLTGRDDANKLIELLLEAGANPHARDIHGDLPVVHVMYAVGEELQEATDESDLAAALEPCLPAARMLPVEQLDIFSCILGGDAGLVMTRNAAGEAQKTTGKGWSTLHTAAFANANEGIVKGLIESGCEPDVSTPDGLTAFQLAVGLRNPDVCLALLKNGAKPTFRSEDPANSLLAKAARMNRMELFSMIASSATQEEKKAVLSQVKLPPETLLDISSFMLRAGQSLDDFDYGRYIKAANSDESKIVVKKAVIELMLELLRKGKFPEIKYQDQVSFYWLANLKNKDVSTLAREFLLESLKRGMSVRPSEYDDSEFDAYSGLIYGTLLHAAIKQKDKPILQAIIGTGQNLVMQSLDLVGDWDNYEVHSPLLIAVAQDFEFGVDLLLRHKEITLNDEILDEALSKCKSQKILSILQPSKLESLGSQDASKLVEVASRAAKDGLTDILEGLIDKGLSLNMRDENGQPVFFTLISHKQDIQTIEWAKKHGADLNALDSSGGNILHELIPRWNGENLNEEIFKYLINSGVDVNNFINQGELSLLQRSLFGGVKWVKILLALGANPHQLTKGGRTLLMLAADKSDPGSLKLFLESGISPHDKDSDGNTALAYIGSNWGGLNEKNKECIRLLTSAGLHPDDAEDRKHLNVALATDDIPFAIWLLEKQAKLSNCDLADKNVRAALFKITRSRAELVSSQLDSLDANQRSLLEPLLSKSINATAEADHNELPELLREGGWPIAVTSRSLVVANKVVLPERNATLVWKGNEEKTILSSRRVKHDADSDKKFEDAISRFEKKPGSIKLGSLTNASDALFIKYWNESSVALNQYVQVAGGGWWASKVMTGFRAEDLRYLLARYGLAVLPGILNLASKKPGPVMKALGNVDAPSCALQVAKFMAGSTSRLARRWLMTYPETAIHGLISPAVGKAGKDRDAAEAALRYLASQGHRDAIEKLAEHAGAEVTASISEILSVDPRTDYMPKKFPALPSFWYAGIHPRPLLRNGGKALSLLAIETLVRMMSISTYDARTPALDDVIDACEPVSLADFSWSVFDEWRAKGDSASNWMFQALAYLSDDRYAKKLTPIIRDWPASNGQAKALMGLDILAAIGTDVALAQIQSIARKNKYKPIVARADEMLMAIAETRELTAEQFEDRLVPTLGLDENGALVLDYGKRRFTGCVDETLKPRLIDETGATLKELPKPGKDDDKALAKQAGEDWAEFKTELKPVASLQLLRLENAMIDARRWNGEEFLRLVAGHPLLQQPARSLVWGLFNEKGKLLKSFCILPDGAAQDVKGKPIEIESASLVGIPHPITLGDEVAAWKKVFADAKQGQAFAQLVRKTYRRQDDAEMDLFGLQGATIHAKSLKGLKAMGWEVAMEGIGALINRYYRNFPGGDVELYVEPGVSLTDLEMLSKEQALEISVPKALSEIEFSELMRELHNLKK